VTMSKYDPGHRPAEQIYNDVDATAWLLPRISSFNSSKEVFELIAQRKAAILKNEVSRVYKGLENFSYAFTEDTFDKCFELRIIHNIESIFIYDDYLKGIDKM